jgi:hypothetical protein
LRARADSVKSGVGLQQCDYADRFAGATAILRPTSSPRNQSGGIFWFSVGHAHFFFSSRKFLFMMKNKILFLFIFFLSVLKSVSSLKPAGEAETRAHVNKL